MAEWLPLQHWLHDPLPGRCIGMREDGSRLDHAGFRQQVQGWQAAFAATDGEDWALYFDDALAFAAALFGAWHAGKRVYLTADNLPATLEAVHARVSGFAGDVAAAWQPLQPLQSDPPVTAAALGGLDAHACELVVFTSGSTGTPTAIVKRLQQLLAELDALQAAFGADLGDASIHGTVSHQHIYGLLFRVLWPLAAGRPIQPRRFFHEDLVQALGAAPSVLVATPAHLKRLPDQLDWTQARCRLRAVFSSGGPLPADAAMHAARMLGMAPIEVYGSSETGGIAWRGGAPGAAAWQPLPGVQWRIGEACLEVSSPHLPDTAWWRTQDRVEALPDGRFRLLGRADRIVKIEERRVSLDALERALQDDPEVAEARVLVLPGPREQLAAVLVPADPALATASDGIRRDLYKRLGTRLARSHDAVTRPRRWRSVAALPLNAQGKVTQAALAALFNMDRPTPCWDARDGSHARLRLHLDAALPVFKGHFAQAAILPGVAQLDWAIGLAREVFDMPPRFLRMDAVKFQHVARPGDELTLQLDWDGTRNALAFRYSSDHGAHSSGKVIFGNAD